MQLHVACQFEVKNRKSLTLQNCSSSFFLTFQKQLVTMITLVSRAIEE